MNFSCFLLFFNVVMRKFNDTSVAQGVCLAGSSGLWGFSGQQNVTKSERHPGAGRGGEG